MEKISDSEFGYLEKKYVIILMLYAIACAVSYGFSYSPIAQLMILAFQCVTAIVNPYLCLAGNITITLYSAEIFTGYVQVFLHAVVIMGLFIHNSEMVRAFSYAKLIFLSFTLVIISFVLGISPNGNTMILMVLCLLRIAVLLNINLYENISTIVFGYMSSGVSTVIYFIIASLRGGSLTMYGRLSFAGDIKSVAIVAAIPMLIILFTRLEKKTIFQNFNHIVFDYILVLALGIVVVLTLARGVLVAIAAAAIFYLLFSERKMSVAIKVLVISVVLAAIIVLYADPSTFRLDRLFATEEYSSGSGRTDIWRYYIDLVLERGPLHVLFGVGPGNINRIGNLEYYAHSTFLDFFFSYGIIGFIVFIAVELSLFVKFVRNREPVVIGLFVLTIGMYLGHGGANNVTMFTLQIVLLKYINATSQYIGEQDNG